MGYTFTLKCVWFIRLAIVTKVIKIQRYYIYIVLLTQKRTYIFFILRLIICPNSTRTYTGPEFIISEMRIYDSLVYLVPIKTLRERLVLFYFKMLVIFLLAFNNKKKGKIPFHFVFFTCIQVMKEDIFFFNFFSFLQ